MKYLNTDGKIVKLKRNGELTRSRWHDNGIENFMVKVKPVPGDCDCFFHALLKNLPEIDPLSPITRYGLKFNNGNELRKVMKEIITRQYLIEKGIETPDVLESYKLAEVKDYVSDKPVWVPMDKEEARRRLFQNIDFLSVLFSNSFYSTESLYFDESSCDLSYDIDWYFEHSINPKLTGDSIKKAIEIMEKKTGGKFDYMPKESYSLLQKWPKNIITEWKAMKMPSNKEVITIFATHLKIKNSEYSGWFSSEAIASVIESLRNSKNYRLAFEDTGIKEIAEVYSLVKHMLKKRLFIHPFYEKLCDIEEATRVVEDYVKNRKIKFLKDNFCIIDSERFTRWSFRPMTRGEVEQLFSPGEKKIKERLVGLLMKNKKRSTVADIENLFKGDPRKFVLESTGNHFSPKAKSPKRLGDNYYELEDSEPYLEYDINSGYYQLNRCQLFVKSLELTGSFDYTMSAIVKTVSSKRYAGPAEATVACYLFNIGICFCEVFSEVLIPKFYLVNGDKMVLLEHLGEHFQSIRIKKFSEKHSCKTVDKNLIKFVYKTFPSIVYESLLIEPVFIFPKTAD